MAEVVGFLRENATDGEKQTLKLLRQNLPKEFTVYVETPLHKKRDIRYPDFIVLTNYGVIVLEVKDWVTIKSANPQEATVLTRSNETRKEPNPVSKARDFALALDSELNSKRNRDEIGERVPWSYAAVLIKLPGSVITQLRRPWGEEFVFGRADLENPDILRSRLKNTFPTQRMRPLNKRELSLIRATIYPVVEIEREGSAPIVLDEQQERIVAEPVHPETPAETHKAQREELVSQQEALFQSLPTEDKQEVLPDQGERISQKLSIRLLRGFSGSGKTLVLVQRAKFLEAQYPEWKIGVLTFNKPLQEQLEGAFRGTKIKARTFHSLCRGLVHVTDDAKADLKIWLDEHQLEFSIIRRLGKKFVENELDWLRDVGVTKRADYLGLERKGVGKEMRLGADQREAIFNVYENYRSFLKTNSKWDWHELPLMVLEGLERGGLASEVFDALLVDEAQDWAPIWFKVINHMLNEEHGSIFLADDPSQSIYRFFSWREKAVNVVGRTRWLRVPYRNTYEIYRAAYSLIANFSEIQSSLSEEGEVIKPELSTDEMRHGPLPLFRRCDDKAGELDTIKNSILSLGSQGMRPEQIAVLVHFHNDLAFLQNGLRGCCTNVVPIHSFKGLEMEAIFIPHIQRTFQIQDGEAVERRLLYMAMSRARSQLFMTYSGKLPSIYQQLRREGLAEFVE
jgi:hypothetical protein